METAAARVTCVLDIKAQSGETPVWSVAEQRLYWVDQLSFTLNRFDPATGDNDAWVLPAHVSSFALRGPGEKILTALRTGLMDFDPATGELAHVAAPPYEPKTHRFNDGRCDRQGRYVIGAVDLTDFSTRVPGGAAVYRLDGGTLTPIVEGITCSNGLAFSPDGRTMYLADTTDAVVYAYDYDTHSGTPRNQREFIRFGAGEGRPDGAEVDADGGYWVALLMKGVVARYRPDGSLDREIPVPVLQPTKVCFGGRDLATLFLTSAAHRHLPGDEPMGKQAGGVFAIETGFRGLPEPRLRD